MSSETPDATLYFIPYHLFTLQFLRRATCLALSLRGSFKAKSRALLLFATASLLGLPPPVVEADWNSGGLNNNEEDKEAFKFLQLVCKLNVNEEEQRGRETEK